MLQKKILKQYLQVSNSPTLKEIAQDTGIQITRVFRLLNGSTMKINEYETFRNIIQQKKCGSEIDALFSSCCLLLSSDSLKEIEMIMKRKLELYKIKQTETGDSKQLTA
jgi:hypothetical protein